MSSTVTTRGAQYFGIDKEPRTSVKVGRREVLFVLQRAPGGRVLAYYNETFGRPSGEYIWLTEKQREALAEALR